MGKIERKLNQLGYELPRVPKPVAEYVPAKKSGNLVFCSGQGPIREGKPAFTGDLGSELTVKQGYKAAQICALNCMAAIKSVVGSLDEIKQVVKVRGFVSSDKEFTDQPEVINGASELLVEVFGERGKHARAALGTSCLPKNLPVELEMIVEI